MFDAPIWWLEARLFDVWEWLTGKDRLSMRTAILVIAIPLITISGVGRRTVAVAFDVVCWSIRWFRKPWPLAPQENSYQMPLVRFLTASIVWLGCYMLGDGAFSNNFWLMANGMASALLWLTDYILWAHHINKPRKRRKPLPEHMKELFSSFDWLPKPAQEGV